MRNANESFASAKRIKLLIKLAGIATVIKIAIARIKLCAFRCTNDLTIAPSRCAIEIERNVRTISVVKCNINKRNESLCKRGMRIRMSTRS